MEIEAILKLAPVMPVITLERIEQALPLARALLAGGVRALEVTLRTPVALRAIELLAGHDEGWVVGAGTVTTAAEYQSVVEAGARFAVSPGLTPALAAAGQEGPIPLLPGVMTPSEILNARDHGFGFLKLFPAEQAGGIPFLNAIHGPLPEIRFCPTGGVGPANLADYLKLPNVLCVGGSWVTPRRLLRDGHWSEIEALARAAVTVGKA
ncbi:MAG: bifunctional 4-hydroxy-2-oxoglutarate aldolase/2-dehydro-3-deoxy-phosphogluconate aldolase [Pseudomonadales bacterium]|jgi:2-dehydro-3-deoxyphosphogluconate aldolase/(4S)-4-hydroxy-2-oxoglutarate aldolase|nr:bifunctional 4-hydroxy-2-oxoglutarate aldolase/2-dehydro-3-deoxy-phosphogluconate aldolase [Pseudomonadales bacterium]